MLGDKTPCRAFTLHLGRHIPLGTRTVVICYSAENTAGYEVNGLSLIFLIVWPQSYMCQTGTCFTGNS